MMKAGRRAGAGLGGCVRFAALMVAVGVPAGARAEAQDAALRSPNRPAAAGDKAGDKAAEKTRAAAPTAPRPAPPPTPPARPTSTPAPAPAAENAPTDAIEAAPPARTAAPPDLSKLRVEYDRLREELFKARVRSQKVSETVFPSKMDVRLRWKGGPDFVIRKARMLLDGAELWDSADRTQTDDVIEVSERSVKPGPHAFTVRLEIRPKTETKGGTKTGADKLGYTSEHTFAIVVAETGTTHLELTGDEDGDPPEYEPELELEIETEK
jgi:hypothetical protein